MFPVRFVNLVAGREIPAEVAARTDELNEFPAEMWQKMGDAGYEILEISVNSYANECEGSSVLLQTRSMVVWAWATRLTAWLWRRLVEHLVSLSLLTPFMSD